MSIAKNLDDRDVLYGTLDDHFLRIGDTQFYVPPTSIEVHRQMKTDRISVIRARSSVPKQSGYFDRIVTLTVFFPDADAINYELRPLLAQAKKCPFLPIENLYLNDSHDIQAITISSITTQTTPGFPHTLQAIIQGHVFEPATYIYDDTERRFDEMFNWPLFRWHYGKNLLEPTDKNSTITFYEPLTQELTDGYIFKIADEEELKAIRQWRKDKRDLYKKWIKDKANKTGIDFEDWLHLEYTEGRLELTGPEELDEKRFNRELDELYQDAKYEYDIHYETMDMGDLWLTDFSVSFENRISSQQLQMHQSPTHQYLGAQDVVMVAKFRTDDQGSISALSGMMNRVAFLQREYHKELTSGFLQFDHQMARLFGVSNVVVEDMAVNTVQGFPGVYDVSLTMVGYNRVEKKMHEVQALTLNEEWKIGNLQDAGIWARPGLGQMDHIFKQLKAGFSIKKDAHKQAIYNEKVLQTFKAVELYPDLELPTHEEVRLAGFDVVNLNDGIFVDPDFFLVYQPPFDFAGLLNQVMSAEDFNVNLYDSTGATATINPTGQVAYDEKAQEQVASATTGTEVKKEYKENPVFGYDHDNLPTEDMEALIRKSAQNYGLNGSHVISFVNLFDKKMRQFYDMGYNQDEGYYAVSESTPIAMDKDFKYTMTTEDKVINITNKGGSAVYLGVMRLQESMGYPLQIKSSIDYNVDQGMRYMQQFWNKVSVEVMNSPEHKPDHLLDLLNLNSVVKEELENAQFILTAMYYLGFHKEMNALIRENKQPSATITKLMNDLLANLVSTEDWSSEKIQSKYAELPLKDYKVNPMAQEDHHLTEMQKLDSFTEADFTDNSKISRSMMHDMLKFDRRGRLVRAFPTFFMTFIDEGQYIGAVKMSDQYFRFSAISDITYTKSRKQAAGTLYCELSNVFGSLDDAEKAYDVTYTSTGDRLRAAWLPGSVAKETERSRHRDPNYYKSIFLRTGVRVHFRMGYGSNVVNIPTIMNGTITSLQNNKGSMTMIAQDDGIELTNKLNGLLDIKPDDDTAGFSSTTKEVSEIVDELLTDSKGFWRNASALMSNTEYKNHSLGLMHFGQQGMPQGFSDFQALFTFGIAGGREMQEINMNVYKTNIILEKQTDGFWNRLESTLVGQEDGNEAGININLYDKTVWDVLNIAAAIGTDYITAVHPFGLRNTIFLGKPYFPIRYDYKVDAENEVVTGVYMKSFKQAHYYDSFTSIIDNSIKADEKDMYTVAVGTFLNEGKIDTTPPIYVDTNIWPEKQKTVNIDTTLNAKGLYALDSIPIIGSILNKPFKWHYDEAIALRIAAAGLRDFVKDMYGGYLTVMGDPSVKPYDLMVIADQYNDINGPADVKEVIHIMNSDVGFLTMIVPDAIAYNSDRKTFDLSATALSWMAAAGATIGMRYWLATKGYRGNLPILNAMWAMMAKGARKQKEMFDNNFFTKKAKELFRKRFGKPKPNSDKVIEVDFVERKKIENKQRMNGGTPEADIKRWKLSGMWDHVINALGEMDQAEFEKMLKKGDNFLYKNKILGYQNVDRAKLKKLQVKTASIMEKGAKGSTFLAEHGKKLGAVLKGIWHGKHALLGPVGILTFAIETALTHIITSTVGEFIERFLMTRQGVIIAPLKKEKVAWLAGVNGHKGSVIGDGSDGVQAWLTNPVSAGLLSFLVGVDTSEYAAVEDPTAVDGFSSKQSASAKSGDGSEVIFSPINNLNSIIESTKGKIIDSGNIKAMYDIDVKAAHDEMEGRKEYLESISEANIEANYDDVIEEGEGFLDKFKDWLSGIGDDEGGSDSDVALDGVAINITDLVKSYEPFIQKYADLNGIGGYTQILMAKMMQESGGRGGDPMQASESLGKPIGYIKVPEESIKQGVKYFAGVLKNAGGDIKLALQSYNFGSGFISYVKERGGKYTKELAWAFSEAQVKRMGKKISRIEPGYGDVNYVDNVLRYYKGSLEPIVVGGADDAPSVTGSEGKKKYHLTYEQAKQQLIDAKTQSDRAFDITIVGGSSTSLLRKGTYTLLNEVAKKYKSKTGAKLVMTSGYRTNDSNWHGTGYGVDIDTPNTMKTLSNGKLGFPPGKDKDNMTYLTDVACQIGFGGVVFGDWAILEAMKRKYSGLVTVYRPGDHHNHLHLSYPVKKK